MDLETAPAPPPSDPLERVWQEQAWALLHTYDYWFRRKYNLAPTDPRYLEITPEQVLVEFWADSLLGKIHEAQKEGLPHATLDDLIKNVITDDDFKDRLREFDAELAREAAARTATAGTASPRAGVEPVIHYRAPA